MADRADRHNEGVRSHQIERISHRVISRSVAEKINEFSVKLEIAGTRYQIFPVVHVSKVKLVKDFPDRPRVELTVNVSDRLDFDEILLPEDSWVTDLGADEYEVERISDVRSGKKTRFGRTYREFLVHWAVYDEEIWMSDPPPENHHQGFRQEIWEVREEASWDRDSEKGSRDHPGSPAHNRITEGISPFQAQTITIGLGVVKIFTGGNRLTLEVVPFGAQLKDQGMKILGIVTNVTGESRYLGLKSSDFVSLAVLKRFHVPDVGSQLVGLQIEMIPVSDEAIPREVALAQESPAQVSQGRESPVQASRDKVSLESQWVGPWSPDKESPWVGPWSPDKESPWVARLFRDRGSQSEELSSPDRESLLVELSSQDRESLLVELSSQDRVFLALVSSGKEFPAPPSRGKVFPASEW
ncbi:hypothetical protein PHMEG_0005536 [Phytophthora megakarya]|uniref:Chromo domain-containing protein n=1 Tax=Phytophthora megakarya TaxID=4795 RepID=A0A225WSN5_9STRA|nr:hypothetical protein PHMEG_0005536 [Phytophthora megakarya]